MSTNLRNGSVLVPLDGSEYAEKALPWSIYLAKVFDIPVMLARVIEPDRINDEGGIDGVQHQMEARVVIVRAEGVECESIVAVGDPADELLDIARTIDSTFISLASHGRAGIDRWMLGSVAEKIVRRATVPVLIQTGTVVKKPPIVGSDAAPIVVPLDGSELAEIALAEAIPFARALQQHLILVRVDNPLLVSDGTTFPDAYAFEALLDASTAYLERVAAWITLQGLHAGISTSTGRAAEFILETATVERASMIVMSTHGRSSVGRVFLGSVADEVVRNSTVPVLLIGPASLENRESPFHQSPSAA